MQNFTVEIEHNGAPSARAQTNLLFFFLPEDSILNSIYILF